MAFENSPKNRQLEIALELNKAAASQGKESNFMQWWYFDTNCISELVKLSSVGYADKVQEFLMGKDVLLTSTSMQELSKAPDILRYAPSAFKTANLFLAPDITKFWYSDFINFFNDDENRIPMNSLDVYPLKSDLIEMVLNSRKTEFDKACEIFEKEISSEFHASVGPDIGANMDERDLCVHIWNVVNEYSQEWFKLRIPQADLCAANFPSFYSYFYAYYFRYVKNRDAKLELNDALDLANCMVVPYCEKYYCEAKFANVLKNVKGRRPPTAFQLIKKMYKKGLITSEIFQAQRKDKEKLSRTSELLANTQIFSFSEMRSQML
ncbi:MAG: hypothetical protein GY797_27990 [Deltaproteobacteria bacterium]|nr:hypothetical protein [Deltaproteobacteria bacterium]